MIQDNASFTFLHRIEEVELNIEDGRWQSALALALTLPDICGGIAFPEIVKRYRDGGRAVLDRNQRPTRLSNGVRPYKETQTPLLAFVSSPVVSSSKKTTLGLGIRDNTMNNLCF